MNARSTPGPSSGSCFTGHGFRLAVWCALYPHPVHQCIGFPAPIRRQSGAGPASAGWPLRGDEGDEDVDGVDGMSAAGCPPGGGEGDGGAEGGAGLRPGLRTGLRSLLPSPDLGELASPPGSRLAPPWGAILKVSAPDQYDHY